MKEGNTSHLTVFSSSIVFDPGFFMTSLYFIDQMQLQKWLQTLLKMLC